MKAVVFDWDGTLVDSQTAYIISWRVTLARAGYEATDEELQYVVGRAFPDCLRFFSQKLPIDPERFERDWRTDFRHRIETELVVYPDAVRCAQSFTESGIPLAIATQTPRAEFERALTITGLRDIAAVTVCRTDVARPKPAPDLYLETCRRLGEDPEHCMAIEDSVVGIASARKAGLFVVGIARSTTDFDILSDVADITLSTLDPGELLRMRGSNCESI